MEIISIPFLKETLNPDDSFFSNANATSARHFLSGIPLAQLVFIHFFFLLFILFNIRKKYSAKFLKKRWPKFSGYGYEEERFI